MAEPQLADLLARIELLERELKEVKARLDEPLHLNHQRRIKAFWEARACDSIVFMGKAMFHQPVFFFGKGKITIGDGVHFGIPYASAHYGGYIYLTARRPQSSITIGNNVYINNNSMMASEGEGIEVGDDTIMGTDTEIYDSDFHELDPSKRMTGQSKTARTIIGKNVFIGSRCQILKGVTIGDDSVIGGGSVVTRSVAAGVIAAGNPARIVRKL